MPVNMEEHRYWGEVPSALARCRKLLKAAGIPLYKIEGRYQYFGPAQKRTPGVQVHRVGCSSTIALHSWLGAHAKRDETRALEQRALAVLRAGGMQFDERGWLECCDAEFRYKQKRKSR